MSSKENVSGAPVRRSRLWWLRTPHSRLLSEWIELKTETDPHDAPGAGGTQAPAA